MREIRFRAWDKKNKKMLYIGSNLSYYSVNNDRYLITQYTGLKDKNGKEIYEGDIIRFEAFAPKHDEIVTAKVEWHTHWGIGEGSEMAGFVAQDIVDEHISYGIGGFGGKKIIGNIYENKELLNEKT